MPNVPSLLSPHSLLLGRTLSFIHTETPKLLGFLGCTVFEEKLLQSLWRLGELRGEGLHGGVIGRDSWIVGIR